MPEKARRRKPTPEEAFNREHGPEFPVEVEKVDGRFRPKVILKNKRGEFPIDVDGATGATPKEAVAIAEGVLPFDPPTPDTPATPPHVGQAILDVIRPIHTPFSSWWPQEAQDRILSVIRNQEIHRLNIDGYKYYVKVCELCHHARELLLQIEGKVNYPGGRWKSLDMDGTATELKLIGEELCALRVYPRNFYTAQGITDNNIDIAER